MHELGIAQEMVKLALDYAAKNFAQRIVAFNIEMSALADESEDALRFHFEHVTRGTIAEDARIEINRVPLSAQCLDCGNSFAITFAMATCPQCASVHIRALPQDEFRLTSIEIE
jgi:hydrogenase nickel incorporation protein HypA/HybF